MRSTVIRQVGSVIIIGLVMLLSITSLNILAEDQGYGTGSTTIITNSRQTPEVKVYFHEGSELNTVPGNKTELNPSRTTLSDGEDVSFDLRPNIQSTLDIEGSAIGASTFGFWIYLRISNPNPSSAAQITFTIRDDSDIIAKNSNPITIPAAQDTRNQYPLEIPFIQVSKSIHTFNSGSEVNISISASISGLPVVITYDRGENDGYILFTCKSVFKSNVAPYNADDNYNEVFYPNLPNSNQRIMKFKGSVSDALGAYNINEVQIDVENIFTNPMNAPYVPGDGAEGYFELEYEYNTGITPGRYSITAYIQDNSGNNYFATSGLTISRYGVYLECSNNSGYGYPSQTVNFRIEVYNVGGNSDSISLEPDPTPQAWTTLFVGGSSTGLINPGARETKTLEVTIPSNAQTNEKCIVDVKGSSLNDNTQIYYLYPKINVVARAQFKFDFDSTSDLTQTIEKGESATYTFKLSNVGSEDDKYTVSINQQPLSGSAWSAKLSTSYSGAVKVNDYEYTMELIINGRADFTLTVTAPDTSSTEAEQLELTISATSQNITEPSLKTKKHDTITKLKGIPPPGKISLSAKSQTIKADPGDTIDTGINMDLIFELNALNEDEVYDYYVQLTVKDLPGTWVYSLTTTDFSLSSSQIESFYLTLEILETEAAGSYSFEVEASYLVEDGNGNDGDETQKTSINLAVTIPEVIDVLLESDVTEKTIQVNQEMEYEFSITYLGNVKNFEIELVFNQIKDWEISLSRTSYTFTNFGEDITLKLTVKPTESAELDDNGKGIVEIAAKDGDTGDSIGNSIEFKTTVRKDTTKEVIDFFGDYLFIPALVILIIILSLLVWRRQRDMGSGDDFGDEY